VDWYRPPSAWGQDNNWSGTRAPAADWSHLTTDPLNGGSSLWAGETSTDSFYAPRKSQGSGSYDPTYGSYSIYDPYSNFTSKMIEGDIQKWMQSEFPELFQFESGAVNSGGTGSAGDVSRDPSFGQFANDPKVYDEIQAAASKYGVPANLVKAMLAREGSGDWSGTNTGSVYLPSRNTYIVGYSGITQPAAEAWGYNFSDLVGNRALQIDAMANGLQRLYQQVGGQYGWDGVIATYYSGDPTGSTTPGDSYQYGTTQQYVQDIKNWWNQQDQWTQSNGGTLWSEGTSGVASPQNGYWAPVNRWDGYVSAAASKYGIPANLIKSMMMIESGGDPNAVSPAGAAGLMQVMPGMHGASSQQLMDPAFNIDKGASILRANYDQYGTWEAAAQAYLGGVPGSNASDGNNTQSEYWAKINGLWTQLDSGISGGFGSDPGQTGSMGPVTNVSAIWGNQNYPISQEHGRTDFATADPLGFYDYSISLLGFRGHPGIDVSMPRGTAIYSPVGGTVKIAGYSGYYTDDQGGPGEIMIELDNGHQIIFGHMAGSYVQEGQRINPGQLIGASGATNGDHLHLEYRIPSTRFGGQQEAVDPRQALQGVFTGSFSSPTNTPGINRPMTYDELLMAAAQGKPVDYGMPLTSGGSWNQWLVNAMTGKVPNRRTSTDSWQGRDQGASGAPQLPGFGAFNPLAQNAMR
jgi:murein DD-endopeptidase MepM/ murein hydrolase activator NlpD